MVPGVTGAFATDDNLLATMRRVLRDLNGYRPRELPPGSRRVVLAMALFALPHEVN